MSTFTPLLARLKHAVELAEKIEVLQAELASTMRSYCADLGVSPSASKSKTAKHAPASRRSPTAPEPRANRVSAEGRARIAEAQKRRWAKWRQA